MITEYERGYRDGVTSAADIVDRFCMQFGSETNVVLALRTVSEGLRTGTVARDIEGKGQA